MDWTATTGIHKRGLAFWRADQDRIRLPDIENRDTDGFLFLTRRHHSTSE
jgi:hypothetical protein